MVADSNNAVLNERYEPKLIPCEVCDSNDFTVIQKRGKIGRPGCYGELSVMGCRVCGYVMINPRHKDSFYIDYYRKLYRRVTNGISRPTEAYTERLKYRGKKLVEYLGEFGKKRGRMLDLGCGVGASMLPFKETGWDVTGVDPDEACVEIGRDELGLNLHLGEAESMSFDKGQFDLVLVLGAIEHFHNIGTSLQAIKNVLKEDGCLMASFPSEHIWGSVLEYFNHNHYRYFTAKTMELMLTRYGFEVDKFEYRQIEERPGVSYVIARSKSAPSLEAVRGKIAAGYRDDPEQRKDYFRNCQSEFVKRCEKFIEFVKNNNYDYAFIYKQIRENKFAIRLIDDPPIEAVKRAILEAEACLKGNVI